MRTTERPQDGYMANNSTFQPQGACTFIGTTARQPVAGVSGENWQSVRVRNLASVDQYFTWGDSTVTSTGAPSDGTPSANTLGMPGKGVETFTLPGNIWMIASSATGFEVSVGEGM